MPGRRYLNHTNCKYVFAHDILAMASGYISTQAVLDELLNSDDDNDYNESMIEDQN